MIQAVVQHHPSRADLLPRLLAGLDGLPADVVTDPGGERPDPWRCYRACLEHAHNSGADHTLIVQDDATVCDHFASKLRALIEEHPDSVLVLFLAAQPARTVRAAKRARADGEQTVHVHPGDWVPAVGNVFPKDSLADLLEWLDTTPPRRHTRSDDHMLGLWHRARKPHIIATIPSLVQHPDDVPSLIGNGRGATGRNPARSALFFD